MGIFLGFIPDEKSNYKIRKVVGEIGRVFEGQEVAVRWVKPESYHITLLYIGNSLNFLSKFILLLKLKSFIVRKFTVVLDKANVGISRSYKELVFLSLKEGGDEVREMLYKLRTKVKVKENNVFIPHISLGRISKDITPEEFRNLNVDVRNENKNLDIPSISFEVDKLHLIESTQDGKLNIIKSFDLF